MCNVTIGANASDSTIIIGNRSTVINTQTQNVLTPVYAAIEQAELSAQDKDDLKAEDKKIEADVVKGELVVESFLSRRLRNLRRMAP